jgi:hypothetical protein
MRIKSDTKINREGMKLKKKIIQQTIEGQIHYNKKNEDLI